MIIFALVLTIVDKVSEIRVVVDFWHPYFGYAMAFIITIGLSAVLNLMLIFRFVKRERSNEDFMRHLRIKRSAVSGIFMLSLFKFDLMQAYSF